jgi:hypothetical protein
LFHCLRRGHAAGDGVCEDKINLELFEEAAGMGWITENRFRKEGAASGFYPVLTLLQIRHIDNMGGYSRLLAMSVKEATQLTDEGAQLHSQWVGAEPFFTQAAARVGYLRTTNDAEYAAYVGELMNAGGTARGVSGRRSTSGQGSWRRLTRASAGEMRWTRELGFQPRWAFPPSSSSAKPKVRGAGRRGHLIENS